MKFSILATLLPFAAAISTQNLRPLDPIADSELFKRHLDVLEAQRNGSIVSPAVASPLSSRDLEKRFIPFIALAGISLNAGAALSKAVGRNLKWAMRTDVDEIWDDESHCRMYFQNVGGANCHVVCISIIQLIGRSLTTCAVSLVLRRDSHAHRVFFEMILDSH